MGSGTGANQIAGDCLSVPQRICEPYKEVNVHTLFHTPYAGTGFLVSGNTWGCNARTTTPNTQPLPAPIIPDALNANSQVYGKTQNASILNEYFVPIDLQYWRQRPVITYGPQTIYARGPSVKQAHSVTTLRRRLRPQNATYQGRNSFYFTDSSSPLSGLNDWMINLHPADSFWTNKGINEPFLAVNNFEQCGQNPVKADIYNQSFIPFCTPLNAYTSSGDLLGQYIGYSFMFYFSKSYMKFPMKKYLPEDYFVPVPPRPKVQGYAQFFSLDCHLFLVANPASSGLMTSPKLNSIRIWIYNKDGTQWDMCNQYMYIASVPENFVYNVTFNHLGGGSESIEFGMNNLRFYITP